jgi:hypothetical protein
MRKFPTFTSKTKVSYVNKAPAEKTGKISTAKSLGAWQGGINV